MPNTIHVSVVPAGPPETEIVSRTAAIKFLNITPVAGAAAGSTGDPLIDELLDALVVGARQMLEKHLWRSLAKKPYIQYMDSFPRGHYGGYGSGSGAAAHIYNRGHHRQHQGIKIWYPPLIECASIIYIDLNGTPQTLTSGKDFQVDVASEPGLLYPLAGQPWPGTLHGAANAVQINFTAGYEIESAEEPPGEADIEAVPEPETEQVSDVPDSVDEVTSYTIDRTIPEPIVLAVKQLLVLWYQNRDPIIAQPGAGGKFSSLPLHIAQIMEAYRCWDWALLQESGQ